MINAFLQYNVNLPPAILSRFDLVHVMIDEPDEITDYNVARHIVSVHQHQEQALSPEYTTAQLQRYIAYARSLKPQVCEPSSGMSCTVIYSIMSWQSIMQQMSSTPELFCFIHIS